VKSARRLSIWSCLLSLILFVCAADVLSDVPPPEAGPIFDWLIVANHRMGPISLGMTEAQLLSAVGDPDESVPNSYFWKQLGLTAHVASKQGTVVLLSTADSRWSFADGVRVGMSELRLRSIWGAPSWVRALNDDVNQYCFKNGTVIDIREGKVWLIQFPCKP
jgi:hypothetical protein